MKLWKLAAAGVLLLPCLALADAPAPPPPPACPYACTPLPPPSPPPPGPWSGDLAVGLIKSSGSTDATSFSYKGDLDWKRGAWENQTNSLAAYSSSNGVSTADNWTLGDKLSYDFTPLDFTFVRVSYLDDHFAGIVDNYDEAGGYGRHILKGDAQVFDADIGIGASQQREAGHRLYKNQMIVTFDDAYLWNITKQSHFKQTLHVEVGQDNTFVDPLVELKLDVYGALFVTIDYEVRYNTTVPAGSVHTNTMTSLNVGYTFGKKP